jgi:hypothetical protein
MTIDEERVRRSLHHQAELIEPDDGSWDRIQEGVAATRRRRHRRGAGLTGLAAAAAVALVFATVSLVTDDTSQVVETGPVATTEVPDVEGAPPPPPSSVPFPDVQDPAPDPAPAADPGIWPLRSGAEVDAYRAAGDTRYDDPVAVARAFAVEYLGMVDPVVGELTAGVAPRTATVVLRPRGEGGKPMPAGAMDTTVVLGALGRGASDDPGGPWTVLSTTSTNIRLNALPAGGTTSPLPVKGQSRAYEGTVEVEVRQDGMEAGEALGRSFVTGGTGPQFGAFTGSVPFDVPRAPRGALVLFTESAADGSVLEATVIGVRFGPGSAVPTTTVPDQTGTTAPDQREVAAFFLRGEELAAVTRSVPSTTGPLRAALEQLLGGPTEAERADGLSSLLAADGAGLLRGVSLSDGRAVVDFAPGVLGNGASTSTGSGLLLEQLNGTVFQFPIVSSVEYRLGGSCEAFFAAIQRSCQVVERPGG